MARRGRSWASTPRRATSPPSTGRTAWTARCRQQYWTWLTQVVQGNLGYSYVLNESVRSLLAQRLPKTAFLAGAATLMALLVAIPIGCSRRPGATGPTTSP